MKITKCPGCKQANIIPLFSLGNIPPVNAFIRPQDITQERAYPLDLGFCSNCTLVQLTDIVPPADLFSEYLHMSSASQSNIKHLEKVSNLLIELLGSRATSAHALEIGSNDGTLLSFLNQRIPKVLGVDPAENLGEVARKKGIETRTDFFNSEVASQIKNSHGKFDAIVALNVVAHTPDFTSLLSGVESLLSDDGVFVMEAAYVVDTILQGQFDTIYHEHVYCFSLHALKFACEAAKLTIVDAEIIPTQGTSIRVIAKKNSSSKVQPSVSEILQHEKLKGFTSAKAFLTISEKLNQFVGRVQTALTKSRERRGVLPIGLGAPARGVVILNYCKLGSDYLDWVIDDTPLKQERLVPGVHLPVKAWSSLDNTAPRDYLLLSWNYRKEVLEKLRARVKSGRVIIPFPEFEEIEIG